MGRIIAAVVLGYAAVGVLVVGTDQIFAIFIPGLQTMTSPPLYYFVSSLATDTAYTVLGGWLCVRIAREHARNATLGLIVLGELIGLVSQILLWHTVPHWFGMGLLIAYPPAIWIGSEGESRR
jgi:hypothetical protein